MPQGFLAQGWQSALKSVGTDKPEQKMATLQCIVWMDIVEPLWQTQNDILHKENNLYKDRETEQLGDRIPWYVQHKRDVLQVHDQLLVGFNASQVHRCQDRR